MFASQDLSKSPFWHQLQADARVDTSGVAPEDLSFDVLFESQDLSKSPFWKQLLGDARVDAPVAEATACAAPDTSGRVPDTLGVKQSVGREATVAAAEVTAKRRSMWSITEVDLRFDFGPGFGTRCTTCHVLTRNRGDKESRKIYCRKCYKMSGTA
jgi:hypothetical protein